MLVILIFTREYDSTMDELGL